MSEGMRRTWWRAAALTVGCGGVAGGWYGLARADSSFPPPAKVEPAVWTRSSAASGVTPAAPAFFPPQPQPVTPASAAVPVVVMPPAPAPLVPPVPVVAPVPPVTTAGLAGSAAPPEFKAVPPKPVPVSASAEDKAKPALPPLPDMPKAPAALPPLPVPAAPVKPPETPEPIAPTLPPLPGVAPPAPPAKSADPVKPVPPIKSDFNLQPGNAGNTVKSDAVPPKAFVPPALLTPPAPVTSVHTEPAIAPPARTVSRAKPADEPMAPSAKSVFVAPTPAPAAPVVPPATTAVATAPPPAVPKVPVTPTSVERPTSIKPDTLAPTPGVDPMTLRQSVLAATIGGALAFPPPAPAAGPAPSVPVASAVKPVLPAVPVKADPTVDDKLKAADEKQKATDEKLKALDKKIDDLTELLKGRKDSTGVVVPSDPGVVEEVKRLKDELARLKTAMDEMKKSTSLRPSTGGTTTTPTPTPTPADPLAGKGTVRVVNDYPIEITMVVNGNSYRVAAGTKLDIPVPAGEFNYKLLSAGANLAETKSPIKEKEVVTLRIK